MLPKSKLDSIETLMSQALIDLDISHEEFKTVLNEKLIILQSNKLESVKDMDQN